MKTIKEEAQEHANYLCDKYSLLIRDSIPFEEAFIKGIELAQRWTPVKKEDMPLNTQLLFKSHNGVEVLFFPSKVFADKYVAYYPNGEWRPIERS